MIYLLYISWLFITQADDCFKGSFELNDLNNCELNCNDDDVKFVDKAEVTFTQILHSCYNVRRGYQLGDCTEVADLVWSDNCGCPFCACASKDVAGSAVVFETIMDKTCYNCTCNAHKYDTTIEGNVLDCDSTYSADSAYEWKDFECPANYCTDDDDDEVDINDYWWADVAVDAKCEKFCYCDEGAVTTCVTGWSNILESENDGLVDAFNRRCPSMSACLDEPDRFFTTSTGPICGYNCPKCDCGTHKVDDKWWVEYQPEDNPGQTQCVQCLCIATGDTTHPSYAQCGYENIDYVKGTGECPPTNSYKCHYESERSTDPTDTVVTVGTLNSQTCYDIDQPSNWCSWTAEHEVNKVDGDVAGEVWHLSWDGCDIDADGGFLCSVFGVNDECFYFDYSISGKDCSGQTHSTTSTQYVYCCNSDNDCNYKNIDISKCTVEKKAAGELMSTIMQCGYDSMFTIDRDVMCSIDKYATVETTCSSVKAFYKKQAECECKMVSGMYKESSSEWKKVFHQQAKGMFSSSGTEWNDPLNCNIDLRCTISSGSVYNDKAADNKIYFVAAIFTAIVVMIIY
eukprot:10935_1